ncbi:tyrosine-type recombinase/integrase [Streptosporangium roseum]|uniref:tyrosine-type recombinase/integrase n=1 Tax=Streptosporangium roseum TaxID=2001 RepID=UPI0001A3EA14|nr:tyrosine-type recombinase/integrase [Streptosporangium roseum]
MEGLTFNSGPIVPRPHIYAGLDLHQLRHSAATHLGEAEIPLQLIMGKTRHKNPRTAMRYVKPGAEAIAKVTEVLAPRRRTH